ncbi:g4294 [Coccomyxa viridis]|uniref:G4294 protein n=1 Tax=Coccomyxa viridis TaxID=1274662 RepID=A0ABP1FPX5_9CHLO
MQLWTQVFTFPPSTDPTLYLMPDGAFTDYGATRQGENSQYFGGSHFEANQVGESAAVVRTIMATVEPLLGFRWDLLFTDGTTQSVGVQNIDKSKGRYDQQSYTFAPDEYITQVYYDTDPIIYNFISDNHDAHYMRTISFQTSKSNGKDAFSISFPLGETRIIRSSYYFKNLGSGILAGIEGWFVYAPHRPEVSGQNQFMKWPTTMTFQFVNPTVGIVLTNTNFTDLGNLPPPGNAFITNLTIDNTNGLNGGGGSEAASQTVTTQYALTDSSTITSKFTMSAQFKGVTPIVDITTTTGYEWSTAQTQSTTTTTTDTTTTTQTYTVPPGSVPAGECRVYTFTQTSGIIMATPYTGTLQYFVQSPTLPSSEQGVFNIPNAGSFGTTLHGSNVKTVANYCTSTSPGAPAAVNNVPAPTVTVNGVVTAQNVTYSPCGVTSYRFPPNTTVLAVSQLGIASLDSILAANPNFYPKNTIGLQGIRIPTCSSP